MKKQNKTINWELAKENPEAFMTELAQIDNHGEMNTETLVEINGGQKFPSIIELPTMGMVIPEPNKGTILY
jgi:hypothetical protein